MYKIAPDCFYSRDHEWLRVEGDTAYLGITDYARHALGDIVFADGEPVGTVLAAGDTVGVVESVKAASDIYTPVAGVIEEINPVVANNPETIGEDPYGCWIIRLRMSDLSEVKGLMDAAQYAEFSKNL